MKSIFEKKFWNSNKRVDEFSSLPIDEYWAAVLDEYKDTKGMTGLDIGCGGGRNTELLMRKGFITTACDLHEEMVKTTQKRVSGLKPKATVIQASMLKLPFPDKSFDVVIANGIFHNVVNVAEYNQSFDEAIRVLKDGGQILINMFHADDIDYTSLTPNKDKPLYITREKIPMVLYPSEIVVKILEDKGLKSTREIKRYIRNFDVGYRSVLRGVFKKDVKSKFPIAPLSDTEISNYLNERIKETPNYKGKDGIYRFGFAMTEPHPLAISVQSMFTPFNTTNVGVHTNSNHLSGTKLIEQQTISLFADLYNGTNLDGYITSGGTEGNIMGVWIGRNLLRKKGAKKITMVYSSLSHHSFQKSSNLLDVSSRLVSLNEDYGIDKKKLINEIKKLSEVENFDGFIVCLTAGYYSTGSSDDIEDLCIAMDQLPEELKDSIYIHVDACFGGFVFPFSKPEMKFDFRNSNVSSMSVDPHKMGLMPYSCGLFFCRKGLLKHVETINEQAHVIDQTLIGSRPGATAASLWAVIHKLGIDGYMKLVKNCMSNKKYFIQELEKIDTNLTKLEFDYSNNFAVSFSNFNDGLLPKVIEQKYRIVPNQLTYHEGKKKLTKNFYHFYVMPSITKKAIDAFIKDLKGVKNGRKKS